MGSALFIWREMNDNFMSADLGNIIVKTNK